jgi:betaine-aldehyde dehydrogenase
VPLFIMAMKLGPALAAGCTVVLKPSPETPLDPYLLGEAILEAELPPGVVNIVAAGRETSEYLVSHPGCRQGQLHRQLGDRTARSRRSRARA